jgi:DNA-binding CsgD family transcriptional regulator
MLRGRRVETAALDGLLERAQNGESAALVLRGEPGIGKTALLEHLVEQAAPNFRIERAAGVESEMELPFAGMHQLCAAMLGSLDRLPGPQHEALCAAFGLKDGGRPDQFLVALAVLSLLSATADERPLLCVVDDAQWFDRVSAQALAFAVREPGDWHAGIPEIEIGGLRNGAARSLLSSVVQGRLDDQVRDRIVAETKGNPLALLELPRGLTAAELAGGFGPPTAIPLSGQIEQSFRRRLDALPAGTQQLLLIAAADPLGDPGLLWRAGESLGLGMDAVRPAEEIGLITIHARVEFQHSLVRSAVYGRAPIAERRVVHRALAEATDVAVDPDHRAWHLAQAAADPDEDVAAELQRSAGRAHARGGLAAAAAILERAAVLTPDPVRWTERALIAAQTTYEAGAPDDALRTLTAIDARPLDALQRATLERLRAQIGFSLREGTHAPGMLLRAAEGLAPLDPVLARETFLEALEAATYAGRFNPGRGIVDLGEAARAAAPAAATPTAVDELLDGLMTWTVDGYVRSVAPFHRALETLCDEAATPAAVGSRWLWLAGHVAVALWDDEAWHRLITHQIQLARDAGALTVLPFALNSAAGLAVLTGDFAGADSLLAESLAITSATGRPPMAHPAPVLAAWRGQREEAAVLIDTAIQDATPRGDGRQITLAEYATAVLNNGLAEYETAFAAAREAARHDELGLQERVLPELIEAAVRTGEHAVARDALAQLSERAEASGTHWALGVAAYSRALVEDDDGADALYRSALEHLDRSRIAGQRARVHLLYGEWLRRRRQRVEARDQLHAAYDTFAAMGARAFAERARTELLATGAHARKRTEETRDALTPQEAQIARLAAGGAPNAEIAAQLFISSSTVAYHLRKVFRKLDITSRRQLTTALDQTES